MRKIGSGEISIHYDQQGSGSDLVLLHGLGNSMSVWDAHVEALAAHHRVLRLDLRGFGASDKPPGPYSTDMFACDLRNVLDGLAIERAHVLGISMGGVIAQRFALDFGQRLRSLILVSTSSEVGEKSVAAWQRLADRIERRGFDPATADATRAFAPEFAATHPEVVAEFGRLNSDNDPVAYAAAARAVADYRWTAELAGVDVPTLILQGLEDRMTPPGGSVKMSRVLPRCRLLMIPGVGHNLPIEKPEVFVQAVLGFTAGCDLAR